jgi:hypothetical protein
MILSSLKKLPKNIWLIYYRFFPVLSSGFSKDVPRTGWDQVLGVKRREGE